MGYRLRKVEKREDRESFDNFLIKYVNLFKEEEKT